jgi:hypothetical protein
MEQENSGVAATSLGDAAHLWSFVAVTAADPAVPPLLSQLFPAAFGDWAHQKIQSNSGSCGAAASDSWETPAR